MFINCFLQKHTHTHTKIIKPKLWFWVTKLPSEMYVAAVLYELGWELDAWSRDIPTWAYLWMMRCIEHFLLSFKLFNLLKYRSFYIYIMGSSIKTCWQFTIGRNESWLRFQSICQFQGTDMNQWMGGWKEVWAARIPSTGQWRASVGRPPAWFFIGGIIGLAPAPKDCQLFSTT